MHVCVWVCVHVCSAHISQKRILDPWSWSHPMEVLGTKLWFSARAYMNLTAELPLSNSRAYCSLGKCGRGWSSRARTPHLSHLTWAPGLS